MSYRYNTIDVAVGVGLCAILFGALLFFIAAGGTYHTALSPSSPEQHRGLQSGMAWLQPAIGQAIVEQSLFERRSNRAIALAAAEWNRATLAYEEFVSKPGGPLGPVMHYAATAPAQHMARVQEVMGRAIVNFTSRGVRSGLVSADQLHSAFNSEQIRLVESRGHLMNQQFSSTWQATLGQRLVEAIRAHRQQAGAIQERLGAALVQLALVQLEADQVRAMQQEQMGSLIFAASFGQASTDRAIQATAVAGMPVADIVTAERSATWPDVPFAYLAAAVCLLATIFIIGLSWAARIREEKELAKAQHDASRWMYRLAS
ncbi:MAG: hypothetical protein NNA18_04615 [Nitrospira sp.]|nr:hypothetical protein [Nitrospira sp.]